ncbi:GIY-YIG nuclease family protein [Aestuariivivens insulae]|uniref:GIY-YIG nuclease family protein n=1 Tax=Aestuariivivens insulae TaxID=1621988 RepID=UPI001F576764|nr:GIY-YIG nuclease family protein [Aestuariivivens insulae]
MDEFVVYILYSEKHAKTYTGYTSNLIDRFHSHNQLATKGYTKKYRPWHVVYVKVFYTKREALAHEKWLKSGQGRTFIKNNILPKSI